MSFEELPYFMTPKQLADVTASTRDPSPAAYARGGSPRQGERSLADLPRRDLQEREEGGLE